MDRLRDFRFVQQCCRAAAGKAGDRTATMGGELNEARQTYDRLWHEAVSAFEQNSLEFDHHLPDKSNDLRRGLSLALRPSRTVQNSINGFLRQLSETAPGQYFYRPEEFH